MRDEIASCDYRYEKVRYEEWQTRVDEIVDVNLEKPLLVRDKETMILTMNFNPEVRNLN